MIRHAGRLLRGRIDLRSSAFANDPYQFYTRWLERDGVHYLPGEKVWLLLSHEAVSFALKRADLFSSSPFRATSPSLHGADPPDHARFRRMLAPFFTREEQLSRRGAVEEIAATLIRNLTPRKQFDAVSDLAQPYPLAVACDWLGLHETVAKALVQLPVSQVTWENVAPSLQSDGLLARISRESDLTHAELAEMTGFFLLAGVSTARDFLLFALLTLLDDSRVVANLLRDSVPISAVTEELLRLEPPVHTLMRRTTETVRLCGHEIPAQAEVWVSLAAANRDPSVFADAHRFVPGRSPNPHVSFGAGPHYCLGSHLGRLEGEVLLEALAPHLSTLRRIGSPPKINFGGIPETLPAMRRMTSWPLTFST